jgi:hypothetical protein
MTQLELHPLCTLFPRLTGADFNTLRDDIAANGLREPIIMHDGMILDGGNRYRACVDAGVKPKFAKFSGDSIGAFVLSANMHRRHLSAGMQAAIVASVQDWSKAQNVGKPKSGNVTGLDRVEDRMAQSGASDKTQRMADKVARESPDLAKKVAHGEISLPKAAKQIERARPVSKIMPRPAPKPAKNAPSVESLTDEVDSLRAELHEAHDTARSLAHELESYESASGDVKAAAKELTRLKGVLHTVETQRDQWMTTCNELRKEVKTLQRKLGAHK